MQKIGTKRVAFFFLFVFIFLISVFLGTAFGPQDSPAQIEEKLSLLTAEEKEILEELFALTQSI